MNYVESDDPIQRAGLRLLSAAAVPIQTEIRRFLARCKAQDRMWAVFIIQAYFRRWLAEIYRYEAIYAAMLIQSNFRGWLVRDNLEDEHYCATQIQRIARGYLATMSVYEDLYNVTVIQSLVRRRFAYKEAAIRLYCVVKIQSVGRMLYQQNKFYKRKAASIKIQGIWRSYSAQMNFQFDIVDIIIVQSIVRRKAASVIFQKLMYEKQTAAATKIQSHWRAYDCTLNFHTDMADIILVQSIVRRWLAIRLTDDYRAEMNYFAATKIQTYWRMRECRLDFFNHLAARKIQTYWRMRECRLDYLEWGAATKIQKVWRGFMTYTDFIFTIADIIIVQRTARKWLAVREVNSMREARDFAISTHAATSIQKIWRGYKCHMAMIYTLVHIIIVQVSIPL